MTQLPIDGAVVIEDPDLQNDWMAALDAAPRGELPTFQWMVTETSTRAHVFATTVPDRSICGFLKRIPDWRWDPQPAPPGSDACSKCAGVGPNFRDSTRWCRGCGRTIKPRRDGTAPKHYLPGYVCPGFGLPVLDTCPGEPPPGQVRMVSDTVSLTQAREVLVQALQVLGRDGDELKECSVPELAKMLAAAAGVDVRPG